MGSTEELRGAANVGQRRSKLPPPTDVVYSAALGHVKEQAAMYALAGEKLSSCEICIPLVFVDDTLANVDSARQHGWHNIASERSCSWKSSIQGALHMALRGEDHP